MNQQEKQGKNLQSELQEHQIDAVKEFPDQLNEIKKEDRKLIDFVSIAVQTDIPQASVEKKY